MKWVLKELIDLLESKTEEELPGYCYTTFSFISSGTTRNVYKISLVDGGEVVLKLRRNGRDMSANKKEVLVWNKTKSEFLAEVLSYDKKDYAWLIMEYIPALLSNDDATTVYMAVFDKKENFLEKCPEKFRGMVSFLREKKIKYDLLASNMGFRGEVPVVIDYAEVDVKEFGEL